MNDENNTVKFLHHAPTSITHQKDILSINSWSLLSDHSSFTSHCLDFHHTCFAATHLTVILYQPLPGLSPHLPCGHSPDSNHLPVIARTVPSPALQPLIRKYSFTGHCLDCPLTCPAASPTEPLPQHPNLHLQDQLNSSFTCIYSLHGSGSRDL